MKPHVPGWPLSKSYASCFRRPQALIVVDIEESAADNTVSPHSDGASVSSCAIERGSSGRVRIAEGERWEGARLRSTRQ